MHGGRTHIDKGNSNPIVFEAGKEKNAKGHLVCLGENSVCRVLFVNFNFINDKTPDPVKVNVANFYLAVDGRLNAFNDDFLD